MTRKEEIQRMRAILSAGLMARSTAAAQLVVAITVMGRLAGALRGAGHWREIQLEADWASTLSGWLERPDGVADCDVCGARPGVRTVHSSATGETWACEECCG